MNRSEKHQTVGEIQEVIRSNSSFYLVDFKGLRVKDISALRERIKETSGRLRVVKNTLLKRASEGTDLAGATTWMEGPTAIAWCDKDPIPLAKVLTGFAKENPNLKVKGGVVSGKTLGVAEVEVLSKLPGLPEVRAQLIGLIQAPATKLARILQTPAKNVAVCISEKGKGAPEGEQQ